MTGRSVLIWLNVNIKKIKRTKLKYSLKPSGPKRRNPLLRHHQSHLSDQASLAPLQLQRPPPPPQMDLNLELFRQQLRLWNLNWEPPCVVYLQPMSSTSGRLSPNFPHHHSLKLSSCPPFFTHHVVPFLSRTLCWTLLYRSRTPDSLPFLFIYMHFDSKEIKFNEKILIWSLMNQSINPATYSCWDSSVTPHQHHHLQEKKNPKLDPKKLWFHTYASLPPYFIGEALTLSPNGKAMTRICLGWIWSWIEWVLTFSSPFGFEIYPKGITFSFSF